MKTAFVLHGCRLLCSKFGCVWMCDFSPLFCLAFIEAWANVGRRNRDSLVARVVVHQAQQALALLTATWRQLRFNFALVTLLITAHRWSIACLQLHSRTQRFQYCHACVYMNLCSHMRMCTYINIFVRAFRRVLWVHLGTSWFIRSRSYVHTAYTSRGYIALCQGIMLSIVEDDTGNIRFLRFASCT